MARAALSLCRHFIQFSLLALTILPISFASEKIPEEPVKFGVQSFQTPDDSVYLALSYKNHPHWHTYWKNPGDSGLPIENTFQIEGEEVQLDELQWPNPERYLEEGDLLAFGYEGSYTLFYRLSPEQLRQWRDQKFTVKSKWLVCKHICIPGQAKLQGTWKGKNLSVKDSQVTHSQRKLLNRLEDLPQRAEIPEHLELVLAKAQNQKALNLYYTIDKKAKPPKKINLITPFPLEGLGFQREKLFKDSQGLLYGRYQMNWEGEYMEPPREYPQGEKLQHPITFKFLYQNPVTGEAQVLQKTFQKALPDYAEKTEAFLQNLTPVETELGKVKTSKESEQSAVKSTPEGETGQGFLTILLLAFIGGFILNFMPCVLPVISLKLFGLIVHQDESHARILKHNLAYTLGVLASFLLLAGAIIGIQSTGKSVGWGFQLQSPLFVGLMIVLLFVFTLNLFGLFEFKTPGGSTFGTIQLKQGFVGDFGGGVLATILATPCSAPFLGTALTFAFTSSPLTIITVFLVIGLGLAFPFILTGLFPRVVNFFPKPGTWMEDLKKVLGLTLILTTLWLIDVFMALTPSSLSFLKLMTGLIFIFFFFYSRHSMQKRWFIYWPALAIALYFSTASLYNAHIKANMPNDSGSALMRDKTEKGLAWKTFSREKLQEYKDKGELVFIDFTAKWCFTCKVNERMVIDTDRFRRLADENNVRLLLADWTRRDPKIGSWLKEHGKVGVPAYFILQRDGTLVDLGETLSFGEIKENLE